VSVEEEGIKNTSQTSSSPPSKTVYYLRILLVVKQVVKHVVTLARCNLVKHVVRLLFIFNPQEVALRERGVNSLEGGSWKREESASQMNPCGSEWIGSMDLCGSG